MLEMSRLPNPPESRMEAIMSTQPCSLVSPHLPRVSTIRDLSWEKARVVLVDNKSDLTKSQVVSKD